MEIEFLRNLCLGLQACTEDVKWDNNLVFSVGGKMFCIINLDQPFGCSFKIEAEEYEELINRPGFKPAPYLARARWVQVTNPAVLHKEEWKNFIRQSYELIKAKLPKRTKVELGIHLQ